ncbi:MAG: polyribonucleotide nucleotidyltransferase, partial [bacterium]|nr:polyribonucleotide nucleotidyltransferase [bacterium]
VRMGYIDGEYIINPTFSQLEQSRLDLVVSGTRDAVSMVEAGAKEVSEEIVLEAIKIAQETNVKIIEAQESFVRSYGKAKLEFQPPSPNEELEQKTAEIAKEAFPEGPAGIDRGKRENQLSQVKEKLLEQLSETCSTMQIGAAVDAWLKKEVRAVVLEKGTRISGRAL